jgi:hypothetical protein
VRREFAGEVPAFLGSSLVFLNEWGSAGASPYRFWVSASRAGRRGWFGNFVEREGVIKSLTVRDLVFGRSVATKQ